MSQLERGKPDGVGWLSLLERGNHLLSWGGGKSNESSNEQKKWGEKITFGSCLQRSPEPDARDPNLEGGGTGMWGSGSEMDGET